MRQYLKFLPFLRWPKTKWGKIAYFPSLLMVIYGTTLGTYCQLRLTDFTSLYHSFRSSSTTVPISGELPDFPDAGYVFGGLPVATGNQSLQTLRNSAYLVGYNKSKRNPAWVAYRLFPVQLESHKRPDSFTPDFRTLLPVTTRNYTGTGYDRGHMAPHYGISTRYPEHVESTFLMSNIIPQKPDLNRELWRKLEMMVAKDWAQSNGDIWVITGPVFTSDKPQKIASGVVIPDACFKILYDLTDGGVRTLAFLMPQDVPAKANPAAYLTTIDRIEELTHLDFSPALKEAQQVPLEATRAQYLW
jgi:endonuclease G